MATKFYELTGRANWARVYEAQKDTKFDEDGVYGLDFYPDDLPAFKSTGVQLTERTSDDGTYFKLTRKHAAPEFDESLGGPPAVLILKENEYVPFSEPIGNGSAVKVKIAVYDTRKGKGHRLVTVAVTDLVEYSATESNDNLPRLPF